MLLLLCCVGEGHTMRGTAPRLCLEHLACLVPAIVHVLGCAETKILNRTNAESLRLGRQLLMMP